MPHPPLDKSVVSLVNNPNLVDVSNIYNHIDKLKINYYKKDSGTLPTTF
jgi:hypothetical protein